MLRSLSKATAAHHQPHHQPRRLSSSCDPGDHVAVSGGSGGCCFWTGWACDQPSCPMGYTAVEEVAKNDGCGWLGRSERTECCTGPGFVACKAKCPVDDDWCWRGCSMRSKGGTLSGGSLQQCEEKCDDENWARRVGFGLDWLNRCFDGCEFWENIICKKGDYLDGNSSKCTPCSSGRWNDQIGSISEESCKPCGSGRYGLSEGAQSKEACTPCSKGKWSNNTGRSNETTTCQACSKGKYLALEGQTSQSACTSCPEGRYNNAVGSPSEDNCVRHSIPKMFVASQPEEATIAIPFRVVREKTC